jgi:hypothetical protein
MNEVQKSSEKLLRAMAKPFAGKGQDTIVSIFIYGRIENEIHYLTLGNENEI